MSKFSRIGRIVRFGVKMVFAYVIASILKILKKELRNVWIISERGDDARDNAFFFYSYMCKYHPEQPIYYIIKSESPDVKKVNMLGRWIEFASMKHYIYYALSKVRISSSMWGGDLPAADYFYKLRKYRNKRKKFVFLKHGIIKDYLPQHSYGEAYPDLYVCGAEPEYKYVKSAFGHPQNVVQYLGLARFDNLHSIKVKKQILVMPTFRRWLQGKSNEEMRESEYIQTWNELLNSDNLKKYLEDADLNLVFYPHYVFQRNIEVFSTCSERIIIARFADYDVQQLLKESCLLVTDFSSVFFDFGYMGKPVVYYQFDRDDYIKRHYDFTKGYFSYDENGFGPVAFNYNQVLNAIEESIQNNFNVDEKYQSRIDHFFPINDSCNCLRIYQQILKLSSSSSHNPPSLPHGELSS